MFLACRIAPFARLPPANISLGPWNLTVQSYEPSSNLSARGTVTTLPPLTLTTLVPWTQLPGLQNISGIGIYTTTFSLPSNLTFPLSSSQILLHLPRPQNTVRATLNTHPLPPIDLFNPIVDISPFLLPGNNTLEVEVSSTLFNAVKARLPSLLSAGAPARSEKDYIEADWADFGLVGKVVVEGLRRVVVQV